MRILLDGDPLPGYDQRVTAMGQIDRKDLSGETRSTGAAHGDWKAWALQVRCHVDFADSAELLALRAMFQAEKTTESHGTLAHACRAEPGRERGAGGQRACEFIASGG